MKFLRLEHGYLIQSCPKKYLRVPLSVGHKWRVTCHFFILFVVFSLHSCVNGYVYMQNIYNTIYLYILILLQWFLLESLNR